MTASHKTKISLRIRSRLSRHLMSLTLSLASLFVMLAYQTSASTVRLRFVDSATGFAVTPTSIQTSSASETAAEKKSYRADQRGEGRVSLELADGSHVVNAIAEGYQPMQAALVVQSESGYNFVFNLDPIEPPKEISPERIEALRRVNETLFAGYIFDEETGKPIANATVRTEPSGRESRSDERGFFQIHVPLQSQVETIFSPAKLFFAQPGYRTEERSNLELSSRGDWIYRIGLDRGEGIKSVDERYLRRREILSPMLKSDEILQSQIVDGVETSPIENAEILAAVGGGVVTQQLASTIAHVRIPTNIRVLRQDGVTIDYISLQTYGHRSLPSEWIASWGNYGPGNSGTNSLNAGAVASRTYAVGYVNNPAASTYDICATTVCQVYNHSFTDSRTTAAVNFTANYVMFKPGSGRVGFKITEYSSENNQIGMACGDGYTAPTGGCIYDPVCAGEPEFGHGRGMCQWGTVKWATGLKFPGNDFSNTSLTNGFPRRDWIWICEHYFPDLVLAQGAPLTIGDDVKVLGTANLAVRQCPGNTITNGVNCDQVTSKPANSIGTIIAGPLLVTGDGVGQTWWQVNWGDTNGWCVENYLERFSATPVTPTMLSATSISATQINLSWTDNAANEIGTYIERAPSSGGPWITNAFVRAGITNYSDTTLSPSTTNHYRVRAFNQSAVSAYSNTTNAVTPGLPPVLGMISNKTIIEGLTYTFTNTATVYDFATELTDFEGQSPGASVLFRSPSFSGSTTALLSNTPNIAAVTGTFPATNSSARVLNVNWAFTNSAANPWLRLTTSGSATLPNPVIDFTKRFRFRIWTDRALRVGLGLRETTTAAGTPIGTDGGTTGVIEWIGVTNSINGQPQPTRLVGASNWVTLDFNIPSEPVRNFSSGNGILSTTSGLGTLEHIAFVPAAGNGAYNVYLDDFEVFIPNNYSFSLSNAPTGATIVTNTGVFSWTPSESQGPGVYSITVRIIDSNIPTQTDSKAFQLTVNETNQSPTFGIVSNRTVHAGSSVLFTNIASDADLPLNILTWSLDVGAPSGANIGGGSGIFTWPTSDSNVGGISNVTIRVTDNGVPMLSAAQSFTISVLARPTVSGSVSGANINLIWTAISGQKYRVQFKNDLSDPVWNDLSPDVTASSASAGFVDPMSSGQRFYRVVVLSP